MSEPFDRCDLQLVLGDASPAEARVYARLVLDPNDRREASNYSLSGRLVGPQCDFAHTLPARMPFQPRPSAGELLAEAVVPDPCFWTPELPFLYRAELEVRSGERAIANWERTIGVRRLGVRGRWLHFDGKRFVLRGMDCGSQLADLKLKIEQSADFARETWTALVVRSLDDAICDVASHRGVLVVADLTARGNRTDDSVLEALRRLSQWPAVAIAILTPDQSLPNDPRAIAPNLLLAQYIPEPSSLDLAPWAQLAWGEVTNAAGFAHKMMTCKIPVIAVRRLARPSTIAVARAACDAMQRELAPFGDFAGYVV